MNTLLETLDKELPHDFFKYQWHDNDVFADTLKNKIKEVDKDSYTNNNVMPVIRKYTGDVSEKINTDLWHYKLHGIYKNPETKDMVDRINNSIADRATGHDIHVYTGLKNDITPQHDIIHIPQFLSTSLHPMVAYGFADGFKDENGIYHHHILRIRLPKGTRSLYMEHFTEFPTEHEVLLQSNQLLKIHGSKEFHHKINNTNITTHIHDVEIMTPHDIVANRHHKEVLSYLKMKGILK